jgi:hypothetical protein
MNPRCPCGNAHADKPIACAVPSKDLTLLPETVDVRVSGLGRYRVSRAYIAFHGLRADELPELATKYGWPRLSDERPS